MARRTAKVVQAELDALTARLPMPPGLEHLWADGPPTVAEVLAAWDGPVEEHGWPGWNVDVAAEAPTPEPVWVDEQRGHITQAALADALHVGLEDITLHNVYNGIGLQTDQGLLGVCMRGAGIEVILDGAMLWSSTDDTPVEVEHLFPVKVDDGKGQDLFWLDITRSSPPQGNGFPERLQMTCTDLRAGDGGVGANEAIREYIIVDHTLLQNALTGGITSCANTLKGGGVNAKTRHRLARLQTRLEQALELWEQVFQVASTPG